MSGHPPAPSFHRLSRAAGVAWPLHTDRLSLAPLSTADAPDLWEYWQLPETVRWMSYRPDSTAALIAERQRTDGTLVVRRGQTVIGDVTVLISDGWSQEPGAAAARANEAELSCAFHPAHTGQGCAREAITAILDLLCRLGMRRIVAYSLAGNTASWRLLERLGLRREGTYIAESLHRELGWVDAYSYAILAAEWTAARHGTAGG